MMAEQLMLGVPIIKTTAIIYKYRSMEEENGY